MNIYTKRNNRTAKIIKKHGAFFAFDTAILEEKRQLGIEYVCMGIGFYSPRKTYVKLEKALKKVSKNNDKTDIIRTELAKHEVQTTGNIDNTCKALKKNGITREEVQAEYSAYMNHCIEYDLV